MSRRRSEHRMNLFDLLNHRQTPMSPTPAAPAPSPSPQAAVPSQAPGVAPAPLPLHPATLTGAPSSPVAFQPGQAVGFFTDSTLCIGCKACEVACKQWNQLPANEGGANQLTGDSYDNTGKLDGINWRHVKFVEQFTPDRRDGRWLMLSDVCKHCVQAGCLEVCPTGAIIRTEFDTVVIQSDVCNGCRACIAACPFGVIDINPVSGTAQKCTLCYDRLKVGLEPACSKACPTDSIQFGPIAELRERAQKRVQQLHAQGVKAELYGADPDGALGGLNSFYLLVDEPEVYGLPRKPVLPSRNLASSAAGSVVGAAVMGAVGLVTLRKRRSEEVAESERGGPRA